jgi:hypothetical protein
VDDAAFASQRREFLRLIHIPSQQDEKFRGTPLVLPPDVSLHVDVARQQRQDFFQINFLADPGHAFQRAQRSRKSDHRVLRNRWNVLRTRALLFRERCVPLSVDEG